MAEVKFTDLESAFIREYLVDKNASAAAKRAGYSEKTAYSAGQRLLKKKKIRDAIDVLIGQQAKRTEITADKVLEGISKIAFVDIRRAYDKRGCLKKASKLPEDVALAISGYDWKHDKVTFQRIRALELLGRHLKLFTDRLELDFSDRLAERLEAARKRIKKP